MSAASPITLELHDGLRTFGSEGELFEAIASQAADVRRTNEQRARSYFALGEMLVKTSEAIHARGGRLSTAAAATEAGVQHKTADRAVSWYRSFLDEESGGFCPAKYRDAQRMVKRSGINAALDEEGNASRSAVQKVMAARSVATNAVPKAPTRPAPTPPTTAVTDRPVDEPLDEFCAALAACVESNPDAITTPGVDPLTGPQLELDFDLAADAEAFAAVAPELDRAVRAGEIPVERAEEAHRAIRTLLELTGSHAKEGAA